MKEEVSPFVDATLVDSTEDGEEMVKTKEVDPEEPSKPEEPENPEEPGNPEKPENPKKPENPEEASNPEEAENPEEPANPEELRNPDDLRNPDNAEEPVPTEAEERGQSVIGEPSEVEQQVQDESQPAGGDVEDAATLSVQTLGEEAKGPGTPDLDIQDLENVAPSVQVETENPDLQTEYEELQKGLEELQKERNRLIQRNIQLQGKLAEYYQQKKGEEPQPDLETGVSDLQQRYQEYLDVIQDLRQKLGEQAAQDKAERRKRKPEMKDEELDVGQHMVDFEQLKSENQVFREKIEECKEELLKLKKKNNNTVQVLTHVKEKLQFVQEENQVKRAELVKLDAEVGWKREVLTRTKQARDGLRADNLRLHQRSGLLGNPTLLRDMEEKVDECEGLQKRLDTLRRQYAEFTLRSNGVRIKLQHSRTLDHS